MQNSTITNQLGVRRIRIKEVQGYFYPQLERGDGDYDTICDGQIPMKFNKLEDCQRLVKHIYESWHAVADEQIRTLNEMKALYNEHYLDFTRTEISRVN